MKNERWGPHRSSGRLGNTEINVNDAEEAGTGPKETGLATPVPGGGVELVRSEDGADDANDVALRANSIGSESVSN